MHNFKNLWDVLLLFLIPIGGGIPGGVLLAKSRGLEWPIMMLLYLISDLILAITFEPIMHLLIKHGKKIQFLARMGEIMKMMTKKTIQQYGNSTGVLALIMIAFGADPMSGRAIALAAGHGFFGGWFIAIAGDMLYFTLLMASTLWLKSVIGNATITMIIIFAIMMIIPQIFRRLSSKK